MLSELATNAIDASPHQDFAVRLHRDSPHSITVGVSNQASDGAPLAAALDGPMPAVTAIQGRGLPIVAALCHHVEVHLDRHRLY